MLTTRERDLQIHPIVPESVAHNTKVITQLHNLTSSLLGVGAGILGLESYPGFLFYIFFSLLVNVLFYGLRVAPHAHMGSRDGKGEGNGEKQGATSLFFQNPWSGLWLAGVTDGLSGFVLTWTLFYGLVRA